MLEFVEAEEKDLDIALEIYNYYIRNTTATFYYDELTMEEFKKLVFIKHTKYKTFLIFENSEIAGFFFLTQYRNKPAYDRTAELGAYLQQGFTGRGLGKMIVECLEDIAKQNEIAVIIASISGENINSIQLFKKMGYDQCAHYKEIAFKFGRKMDVIDFQKVL